MRGHVGLISLLALLACNGGNGEDSGNTEYNFPTGCIATSAGGSFAALADAIIASPAGTTITLCPEVMVESVEVIGKALTIEGVEGTEWVPPANVPAIAISEGADVTVTNMAIRSTRNGIEVADATVAVESVTFDAPGNYAVEGTNSTVTLTDVDVLTPAWGGVHLGGEGSFLTATRLVVDTSTGNAVTLDQGASGAVSESTFSWGSCTNNGVNCLESDGWGIEITDGGALSSTGNTFEYNLLGGIRAESASVESTDDTLFGNYAGMWIENGTLTANGTVIEWSDQYGILGLTMDANLTDVSVVGDPSFGYYEVNDEDTDGDGVLDSSAVLDGTYGILGFDTALVGDGIEVSGHNGGGIYLTTRLDTSVSMTLSNAIIDNNAAYGVFALLGELDFTNVDITNTRRNEEFCYQANVIQCDGGMWAAASDVTWSGGSVAGNEYIGYLGIQNNHTLTGVHFADNEEVGIRVDAGALSLTDGELSGSGNTGIVISSGGVATIEALDAHDRDHAIVYEYTDGSSYTSLLAATELLVSDSTATVSNSTFARGNYGLQASGPDAVLNVEDSTFTDYNRRAIYTFQGAVDLARSTFANVGGYVVYCSSGSVTGQTLGFTGVPSYTSSYINTDVNGVESPYETLSSAAAIYASSCALDFSSVQMTDVLERALYASSGSTQLDNFTVQTVGEESSSAEGAIHLTSPTDALLNDVDISGVVAGDGVFISGSSATTTSVRFTELALDGIASGSGVKASTVPDLRFSGLSILGTAAYGLNITGSTTLIDGTALAATGIISSGDGVLISGGTASVANVTLQGAVGTGLSFTGGVDHEVSGVTVEAAGTYGMECDATATFAACDSLSVDGVSGAHLGCDTCFSLAGL